MNDINKILLIEKLAYDGGFVDCLTDLPYDNWEQNFEYVAETLARFYVYVDERLNEDDLK